MAINVSQAFHRTSANPIDDSMALTKAEMLTVNDNLMPSKYLTVCQDDGYIYLYDKSATPSVQTGKFSKFEGGGSGASALEDLTDVQLQSLTDGQALVWDDTNSKWVNQTISSSVAELGDVGDVNLTSPTDGQALVWDETNSEWVNETISTSVEQLEDVGDVDLTNIADGQILKWDGTNSKWVNANESGGGGDAELEEAVTANTAAGAIEVGTTLPQGMTFTEFVKALVIADVDPTINFSISQSGTVSGGSYVETLTCAVTNLGSAKKIKTISWYEGETLKRTDNVNATFPATYTYTMPTATTTTTTFKAVVVYTNSKDIDTSVEKTDSITFGSFKYYGAVDVLDPTEATVKALTQVAATSRGGAYSFTTDDNRACYAYPKSFGELTAITDPNGFNLFYSFTKTEQTYTIDGQSIAYYRYVLTDEVTVTNFTVTFT